MGTDTSIVSVEDILPPSPLPPLDQPSEKTLQEEEALIQAAKLESFKQDTQQRAEYAPKIYWLIVACLASMFGTLILQGFHIGQFGLSDSVLTALIAATSGVVGILAIVAQYIFRK